MPTVCRYPPGRYCVQSTWEEPGEVQCHGLDQTVVFTFGSESEAHSVPTHHATWAS